MDAAHQLRDGYLYVRLTGEYTTSSAMEIFQAWLAVATRHGLTRALCDMTGVTGFEDRLELTMERYRCASHVAESLPKGFRLSVLALSSQLDKDGFVQNVMLNKGAAVRVTADLAEALRWLQLPAQRPGEQKQESERPAQDPLSPNHLSRKP